MRSLVVAILLAARVMTASPLDLPAAGATADDVGVALCSAEEVFVLPDVSPSVDDALLALEARGVRVIAEELGHCSSPPPLLIAAFATDVTHPEPPDLPGLPDQLARLRAQLPTQGTDPTAAASSVLVANPAGAAVVIITDGRIEPGPGFGPPKDPQAYLARLRAVRAQGLVFMWALRPFGATDFEGFRDLWRDIEAEGLGHLDVVSDGEEVVPPFSAPAQRGQHPSVNQALSEGARPDGADGGFEGGGSAPSIAAAGRRVGLREWLIVAGTIVILWGGTIWGLRKRRRRQHRPHSDLQFRVGDRQGILRVKEGEERAILTPDGSRLTVSRQSGKTVVHSGERRIPVPPMAAVSLPNGVHIRELHPGMAASKPWPALSEPSSGQQNAQLDDVYW
jgi:hypothetical protein